MREDPDVQQSDDHTKNPVAIPAIGRDPQFEQNFLERSPRQIRTEELIDKGYEEGANYEKPEVSEEARTVGGYSWDKKPQDFDNLCLVRETAEVIHKDYREAQVRSRNIDRSKFSYENMLLEILQNAEPKDSRGTWFNLEFLANNKWHSAVEEIGDFGDEEIIAIRVVDNGRGYMINELTDRGGDKRDDSDSAGRFGSGMKLSDCFALTSGLHVIRYSRNWRAEGFTQKKRYIDGHDDVVAYKIDFSEECFPGSVVEYRENELGKLAALIAILRKIQDIYLPLDKTLEERLIAHNQYGIILNPRGEHGDIKVHGRNYELSSAIKHPLLFAYDLHTCDIDDQNRHYADTGRVTENIRWIWSENNNPELFKQFFQAALDGQERHELGMRGLVLTHPDAFKDAAKEVFEIEDLNTVYIDDSETTDEDRKLLKRQGYQAIKIGKSKCITGTFADIGVFTGRKLIESITREIPGLYIGIKDYQDETFPSCACRAITSIRNLEEFDDAQKEIVVVLKDSEGEKEMSYEDFIKSKDKKKLEPVRLVVRIKSGSLENKGNPDRWGYMPYKDRFDGFIGSCAAAGVEASIYNGNEEINPFKKGSYAEAYLRNWGNLPARNLEIHIYIENVAQAAELRKLHKYSLNLDPDYSPVVSTEYGDIVALGEGKIYEQGILKNNFENCRRIFSYNIPDTVTDDNLARHAARILNASRNIEVQRAILVKANKEGRDTEFIEYSAVPGDPEVKDLWKQAFEETFGQDMVLDDCEEMPCRELVLSAEASSGIKKVRLNPQLRDLLLRCGVRRLSEAIRGEKVVELDPNPVKGALLEVYRIVDRAIKKALPKGMETVRPRIRLARSVTNCYGQEIRTGSGYRDPIAENGTIYVFDEVVRKGQIDQLVTFILNKKVEAYRRYMTVDQYTEFKAKVLVLAERSITTISFFQQVRRMILRKSVRIPQLVEKVIDDMEKEEEEEDLLAPSRIQEIIAAIRERIKGIKVARAERRKERAAAKAKRAEEKAERKRRRRERPYATLRGVGRVTAYTAAAVLIAICGQRLLPDKAKRVMGELAGETAEAIHSILPDVDFPDIDIGPSEEGKGFLGFLAGLLPESDTEEYSRPFLSGWSPIGVGIERSQAGNDNFDDTADYIAHQQSNFLSFPPLEWGRWMAEQSMGKYSGKAWKFESDAPDFGNPHFQEVQRTTHSQKVKPGSTVLIRTMAGGYIDADSIRLVRADGTESTELRVKPSANREYEVQVQDENAEAILYQTTMAVNWMDTAGDLTDADFAELSPEAYAYYTDTPDLDLSKIRFNPKDYPKFQHLGDFMNWLKQHKPFDRVKILRDIVNKMRYTRTKRTEEAYRKFHNGDLPEKDFLEFVLNSDELQLPGDGDCDGQNSVFALLARYAGIPAKLDYVFTEDGVGHGPASIYLPKIGWILTDTMGERSVEERIVRGGSRFRSQNPSRLSREDANRRMIEIMQGRREYQKRQCDELLNGTSQDQLGAMDF